MPGNENTAASENTTPSRQTYLHYGLAALLFLLTFLASGPGLASGALLDEQFLIAWLKDLPSLQGIAGFSGYMNWPGFESFDAWGPASKLILFLLVFLFGKSVFLLKFAILALSALSSVVLYFVCRKMNCGKLMPFLAGLFFAVYPLHFETAAWVGGVGSSLATLFFLVSFYIFLHGRERKTNWLSITLSSLFFLLSIASSRAIWPSCLLFALFEFVELLFGRGESGNQSKQDSVSKSSATLSLQMIACLMPVLLSGVYLAGSGAFAGGFLSDFRLGKVLPLLKYSFMPVNEVNWHRYSKEYLVYYILYPFLVLSLILSFAGARSLRKAIVFSLMAFLLLLLPACGLALVDSSLYGERLLCPASFALCLFLAAACSGPANFSGKLKYAAYAASAILALVFSLLFFRQLWNENAANRNCSRVLKAVQKSMRILQEKERAPLFIVRDLPEKTSIVPAFSPRGPVVFDASKGLTRSNPVPDGRLKELLRAGKVQNTCFRFEPDLQSFIPLDLGPEKSLWLDDMGLEKLSGRMEPAAEFYSNIHWNKERSELILESNSENGPMFTVNASELSTLDGDYLYLDAIIDAPGSFASPRIELHWQTRVHKNYEKKERFSYSNAIINDGKVHRYLLSLRSNAWTTGGVPRMIALGFPAGSRVRLSGAGLLRNASNMPVLNFVKSAMSTSANKIPYTPPYYDYPSDPALGLLALSEQENKIECTYSAANIEGARGVLLEISRANCNFDDANSNHLSGQTYKTMRFANPEGQISIPVSELPDSGVYSLRVAATGSNGELLGQFSNPLCCQVPYVH